jgi:glucose/arabinose dehydrogenase
VSVGQLAARVLVVAALAASCTTAAPEIGDPPTSGTSAPASPTGGSALEPTGPTEAPSPGPFDPDRVVLDLELVVTDLEAPVLVTNAGDGSGRLFVLEQPGRIRVVRDAELQPAPFLDISSRVVWGGEQGLLGLAFHPRFASNGRFFVNYTDLQGDTVVAEYAVSADDPDVADPDSERVLLGFTQPFANHNGGALAFGPDGYLYVATGDGGSAGDPFGNGQSLDTLLGKLLRIDVNDRGDGLEYGIPPDNPFADRDGARAEIWAYGLRNPWRFSFDPATGALWIGDVGQGSWEEIDHVVSTKPGLNFGWNITEGDACFQPLTGCDRSGITLPVAVYDHGQGCSVTGGYVYRGDRWPALFGAYLFADYCSGTIWGLDADARKPEPSVVLQTNRAFSSFGEDEAGELYVTDLSSNDVFRIVAPSA